MRRGLWEYCTRGSLCIPGSHSDRLFSFQRRFLSLAKRRARLKEREDEVKLSLRPDQIAAVTPFFLLMQKLGVPTAHYVGSFRRLKRMYRRYQEDIPDLDFNSVIPYIIAKEWVASEHGKHLSYHEADVVTPLDANQSVTSTFRPTVVALLGHVDHGKTTLLDAWLQSHQTENEPGEITQSIRAYNIRVDRSGWGVGEHDRVTVIDTPGHVLFSDMRQNGALICDVVVLVIDINIGVCKQTKEAISLALELDRPIIVALNKVDVAAPDALRGILQNIKHRLEGLGVFIEVRTEATAGKGLPREGVSPAIPVSGLKRIQTELILKEILLHKQYVPKGGERQTAVIVDASHNVDVKTDKKFAEMSLPDDDITAAFSPLMTKEILFSPTPVSDAIPQYSESDATLSCICRSGVFTAESPTTWLAGRGSWGTTAGVFDEWGNSVNVVHAGEAFQIKGLHGDVLPGLGSHLIAVSTSSEARGVIQHRKHVTNFLRGGGDPSLLTPSRSSNSYYWLQAAVVRDDAESAENDDELSHIQLHMRGLLCPSWEKSMVCAKPNCTLGHPKDMHIEPPQVLHIFLCADTEGSHKMLKKLVGRISDRAVRIEVVRDMIGAPTLEDLGVATAVESYGVVCFLFRQALPRHLVALVVTQKVDVYELDVFADVAQRLLELGREKRSTWLTQQQQRWEKYATPKRKRRKAPDADKRLQDLFTDDAQGAALQEVVRGKEREGI